MSNNRQTVPFSKLQFFYRNYRGEEEHRTVTGPYLWHGTTPHYTEPQWILRAFDENRKDFRDFAIANIIYFGPPRPADRIEDLQQRADRIVTREDFVDFVRSLTPEERARAGLV